MLSNIPLPALELIRESVHVNMMNVERLVNDDTSEPIRGDLLIKIARMNDLINDLTFTINKQKSQEE